MPAFAEKIFFGNPVAQFQARRDEIMQAIENVCVNGPHILGPSVDKFELDFATWNNTPYAVGVASGTDALVLALKAFGIGLGDEVITVSHTALATVSAIVLTGATPVLIDADSQTYTMDVTKIEGAITSKTKAIIPVHLYGYACDMHAILDIAKRKNLIVIEDCAQAHGTLYHGKKVGSMGDVGCFSFYPTKNLGAIGDGGAVITSHQDIAEKIKKIRQYGWDQNRVAQITGTVSRLDTLQAAVLSVKLKYLDSDLESRRRLAYTYDSCIDWKKFSKAQHLKDTNPSYHLYVITSDRRKEIMDSLQKENIIAGIHYEHPAHTMPGYKNLIHVPQPLTVTEKLAATVLSLPLYPELTPDDAQIIGKVLNGL